MDSLITGLAGIVVVALPLIVWLKFAVRARRKRELDEIKELATEYKELATERSQLLDELHSRLDALDERDSQHCP